MPALSQSGMKWKKSIMEYNKTIQLKDGRTCLLRNGTEADGRAALENFNLAHAQTDFLLSYPDESDMTAEQEAQFLKGKTENAAEIEMLAEMDGRVLGLAGIESLGRREKTRHRAEFGISIDQNYWGLGVGRALTEAGRSPCMRAWALWNTAGIPGASAPA